MNTTLILDALTMCLLNLFATVVLTTLHVINALYRWPNAFVAIAAPLGAAVFFVLTAIWLLEFSRRANRARHGGVAPLPRLGDNVPFRRAVGARSL